MTSDTPAEAKRLLRSAGLRATAARRAVLGCLAEAQAPLTHAEVCERLASLGYDRATLYRNLVDLTEVGLLTRNDLGDHLWRFELSGSDDHSEAAHPHFVCTDCGDVSCLPEDTLAVSRDRGVPVALRAQRVEIQVRGLCDDCN